MRSRSNGGVIRAFAYPNQNYANGVFFIHDAAIYNTGQNPIWPLASGLIFSATGGTISTAVDNPNYKVHTFTSNGTFTITNGSGLMEILLVGGGGSGGMAYSGDFASSLAKGGGGAGGVITLATNIFAVSNTTFTVEVGSGGSQTTLSNYNDSVIISGKPSKVTSSAGHTYTSLGGGPGRSLISGAIYDYSAAGRGGGGGSTYSGIGIGYYSAATSRSTLGSGTPGTITNYSALTGGTARTDSTGSGGNTGAGGGAGYQDGYSGLYALDTSKSSRGGNGYQWSRTGLYYGAGGPGGTTYLWPGNRPAPTAGAMSGLYGNSLTYGENSGWAYNNQSSTGTGGNVTDNYGVGGQGAATGWSSGVQNALGGAGSPGTVIICYRYK